MKLTDRVNAILHPLMQLNVQRTYHRQISHIRKCHPDFFGKVADDVLKRNQRLWSRLLPNSSTDWCEMLGTLSGNCDWRYVPEDVFYCVIERCLNDCNALGAAVDDKNEMDLYVPKKYRPKKVLGYVRGLFFDGDGYAISKVAADDILGAYQGEVVGKPASGTSGGSGVICCRAGDLTAEKIMHLASTYVVQERLHQETEVARFNPSSLNTCRIITFRRPWSGETTAIAGMLRMGCSDSITDNVTAGGICVAIHDGGALASFGLDHGFNLCYEHPRSRIVFDGFVVPQYQQMCEAVVNVARQVPAFNLLGFDVIVDPDGTPKIVEINPRSMAMLKLQTQRPLFGDETEQVVAWCEQHRSFDHFDHIRTWY